MTFCRAMNEDTTHVLTCTHVMPTGNWEKHLPIYDNKLIKLKIEYPLQKAIILEVCAWRNSKKKQH